MKKTVSFLLILTLSVFVFTGCSKEKGASYSGKEAESISAFVDPTDVHRTIAVSLPSINSQIMMFKDFLNNNCAEPFNVDFIYSEALNNDVNAELQFLENAYNSGAEGFLSFNVSTAASVEPIVSRCDELGLWVVVNGIATEDVLGIPYFAGMAGAGYEGFETVAKQYGELTRLVVEDGKPHNVVISSMGAAMGAPQHILSTVAALETLSEIYNLEYSENPRTLATSKSVTSVDTGTDMKITIVPGIMVVKDIEQVLKGGEFDVLISMGPQFAWFQSVIDAVEKQYNMNIKTCSIIGVDKAAYTSFHTNDITGDPSLNAALIKNSTLAAQMFVLLYNAMTGGADKLKVDGKAQAYQNLMWICESPEKYDLISKIDSAPEYACYTVDEMKDVIAAYNPALVPFVFKNWCINGDLPEILKRRNL